MPDTEPPTQEEAQEANQERQPLDPAVHRKISQILTEMLGENLAEEVRGTIEAVAGCAVDKDSVEVIEVPTTGLAERFVCPTCIIELPEVEGRIHDVLLVLNAPGTLVIPAKMLLMSTEAMEELLQSGQETETLVDAIVEIGNMLLGSINQILSSQAKGWSKISDTPIPHLKQSDTILLQSDSEIDPTLQQHVMDQALRGLSMKYVLEGSTHVELLFMVGVSNFVSEEEARAASGQSQTAQRIIRVGELMRTSALSLAPDDTVKDGLTIMQTNGIQHLPVVDEGGKVQGVVSRSDLLGARSIFLTRKLQQYKEPRDEATLMFPVRWFQRKPVLCDESTRLFNALDLMARDPEHVVVVTDDQGAPKGLLGPTELIKYLSFRFRGA